MLGETARQYSIFDVAEYILAWLPNVATDRLNGSRVLYS